MNWTCTICSEFSSSANFQNSTVRTDYPSAHQPSLAAHPRTYILQTVSYDVSIGPRHLSVLPTVMFHPRFRHDIQTTAAVFYLTLSGRSAGSSLQSAGGRFRFLVPPPGTSCLSTSHLHRHSRFSRPFCFPVPTKTLSYDSC